MNAINQLLAKAHEKKLAVEVRLAMPFLFTEQNARIIPNEHVHFLPSPHRACVNILSDEYLLFVCRERGKLDVQITGLGTRSGMHDLALALSTIREEPRREFKDLWDVSKQLESHMHELTEYFWANSLY